MPTKLPTWDETEEVSLPTWDDTLSEQDFTNAVQMGINAPLEVISRTTRALELGAEPSQYFRENEQDRAFLGLPSASSPIGPPWQPEGLSTIEGGSRAPLASFREMMSEPTEQITKPPIEIPTMAPVSKETPVQPWEAILGVIGNPILGRLKPELAVQFNRTAFNQAAGLLNFLTSPAGATVSAVAPAAPTAAAVGFTADMLKALYEQGKEAYANWDTMSAEEKLDAAMNIGATAGMAGLTGLHARTGVKRIPQTVQARFGTPPTIPVPGRKIVSPPGAPVPRIEPPPQIQRAAQAEAEAEAKRMQQTATAAFEPQKPGKPVVPTEPEAQPDVVQTVPGQPTMEQPTIGTKSWFADAVEFLRVHATGTETREQIKALLPMLKLSNEHAKALALTAWGEQWKPGGQIRQPGERKISDTQSQGRLPSGKPSNAQELRNVPDQEGGTTPAQTDQTVPITQKGGVPDASKETQRQVSVSPGAEPSAPTLEQDIARYQELVSQIKSLTQNRKFDAIPAGQKELEAIKNRHGGNPPKPAVPAAAPAAAQTPPEWVTKLPQVQSGYTRLYHGQEGGSGAGGAEWTTDPVYASRYGKNVQYLDLPSEFAEGYRATGGGNGGRYVISDLEVLRNARQVPGEVPTPVTEISAEPPKPAAPSGRHEAPQFDLPLEGETPGRISPRDRLRRALGEAQAKLAELQQNEAPPYETDVQETRIRRLREHLLRLEQAEASPLAAEAAAKAAAEEAKKKAKFEAFTAKLKAEKEAREAEAQKRLKAAEGASAVRLESTETQGGQVGNYVIISKDPAEPGKWRGSRFSKDGTALGHVLYDSMEDAIRDYSGAAKKGPSWGVWQMTEVRKPSASKAPEPATSTFTAGQSVWVGQEPMHREGTLVAPGPRGGWFVKTNLGETFYEAADIRPKETKPPQSETNKPENVTEVTPDETAKPESEQSNELLAHRYKQLTEKVAALTKERETIESRRPNLTPEEGKRSDELARQINATQLEAQIVGGEIGLRRMRGETEKFLGQKEPEGTQTIPGKVLKAHKSNLLQQVDEAIDNPRQGDMITFEVPGDGEFTIPNSPEQLKKFRARMEKEFPTTAWTKPDERESPAKGTTMPTVSEPKDKDLPKLGQPFVSTDKERGIITSAYSDGTQIVATSGTQLVRIVTDKAPGTPAAPVRIGYGKKGEVKISKGEGRFPNWQVVSPDNPTLVMGGADTGQLWYLAKQAQTFRDAGTTKGKGKGPEGGVEIFINPDKSFGARLIRAPGESFEHNVQPEAKSAGTYNPEFLLDSMELARRLGNEKVDFYVDGDAGPAVFRGKNHEHLLMPMRIQGDVKNPRADPSHFTGVSGRAVHGKLPTGLGPLEDPESVRSSSIDKAIGKGQKLRVDVGDGKVKVIKMTDLPSTRYGGGPSVQENTIFEADYPTWDAKDARMKALQDALKQAEVPDPKPVATSIAKAAQSLLEDRQKLLAEQKLRQEASPTKPAGGKGPLEESDLADTEQEIQGGAQAANPPSVNPQPLLPTAIGQYSREVKGLSQIIRDVAKGLGLPIRFGRLRTPKFAGYFNKLANLIAVRKPNQIQITMHEAGHKIDALFGLSRNPLIAAELDVLGDPATAGSMSSWTPSNTRAYKMGEGVAEFTRYWLTNPTHARTAAPHLFSEFERTLDANEDYGAVMRQAQSDILRWRTAPAQARLASLISTSSPNGARYGIKQLTRDVVDSLHFLRLAMDDARNHSDVAPSRNIYQLARALRGAYGMADIFVRHGVTDFNTRSVQLRTSLKDALKPVAGKMDDFRTWIVAKRLLELRKAGRESGIPLSENELEQIVQAHAGKPEFQQAFDAIQQWQDSLLKYAVDAKLISPGSVALWKRMNEDYVPLHRIMEIGAGEEPAQASSGIGAGLQPGTPGSFKKFSGKSTRDIIDPLETMVKNAYAIITASEKNAIYTSLADLSRIQDMGKWVERVSGPREKIEFELARIREQLEAAGADLKNIPDELLLDFWRASRRAPWGENMIAVKRGDKVEFYRLDSDLYKTFKSLDEDSSSALVRWMAIPGQLLRAGVTLTPDFATFNALRDTVSSAILSKYSHVPFLHTLKGLAALLGNEKLVSEWAASGGRQAVEAHYFDRAGLQKFLSEHITKDMTPAERALVWTKSPLMLLRVLTGTLEEATRLGEFQNAYNSLRKSGMSEGDARRQAAFEARDLQDFAKGGAKTKMLRMLTPFWNAQLQGNVRFAQAIRQRPILTAAKGFAWITIPKMLEQAINWDDEDYWDRPQWERDLFFLIPFGKDENGHTKFLRLPTPFEVGIVFGTVPGRFLQWLHDRDPSAFKGLQSQLLKNAVPNPVPQSLQAIGEVMAGKQGYSFWRGRPIVPEPLKDTAPELQFTEQDSLTARHIGDLFGISPAKVDYLIQGWTGGLGKQLVNKGIDRGISAVTGEPVTALRTGPLARFVTTPAGLTSQAVESFYQTLNEARQEKSLKQAGRQTSGKEMRLERLEEVAKEMADLRKAARQTADPVRRQQIQLRIRERARIGLKIANP